MKRQIKFRAWCFLEKKMIDPSEVEEYTIENITRDFEWDVQQFTGLTDKNGKEIYEGDIITAKYDHSDLRGKNCKLKKTYAGIIHWNHSYWAIGQYKLFIMDDDSLKIIGNIHENPELLK